MKTLTIILTFVLISLYATAQSISFGGFSVASNYSKGDGKRMYYVIGQTGYLSLGKKKTTISPKVDSIKPLPLATYSVKTYPNPAKDVVCVQFSQDVQPSFKIFDCLGNDLSHLVSTTTSSTLYRINIQNLGTGAYFVKIISASQPVSSFKIIKQN